MADTSDMDLFLHGRIAHLELLILRLHLAVLVVLEFGQDAEQAWFILGLPFSLEFSWSNTSVGLRLICTELKPSEEAK